MFSFVLGTILTSGPPAPLPSLVVGSHAPRLQVADWVHGPAIDELKVGNVYLVEFWATWCPPCVSSAPHLAELQRKYASRGLKVVGITQLDNWGSDPESISRLLKAMGPKMDYPIGVDAVAPKAYQGVFNGRTECSYLGAAQVQAIPCSFLIDRQGRIAFIGLPTLVDAPLKQVMDGEFDMRAAATVYAKNKRVESDLLVLEGLLKGGKFEPANALAASLADASASDARVQSLIADELVGFEGKHLNPRNLKVALACAQRAVDASHRTDPEMLASLAGVLHYLNRRSESDKLMRDAISLASGVQRDDLVKRAKLYKQR